MKNRAFLPLCLMMAPIALLAQPSNWMDINKVEMAVRNNGVIANEPNTGATGLFYPKGQRQRGLVYAGGLWVAGKVNGQLRTAVSYYTSEFQPGPILPDGAPADPSDPLYNVAKYNLGDTPDPALVPLGCPAEVWGHQMLFCVYNDLGPEHAGVFQQPPIGLEVQQTVWAYDRSSALGTTVFIRFVITNKNSEGHALDSVYVGLWLDPDIGDSSDDALGYDSELMLSYAYNSDNDDAGYYGDGAPAVGAMLLQGPLVDAPGQTVTLPDGSVYEDKILLGQTAFFTFLNTTTDPRFKGPKRDATGAATAYTYMKGLMGNGEPWVDPVTGESTVFPYSGDPVAGTGWVFDQGGDVSIGNSSGPITLGSGESQVLVYAIVVGDGSEVSGDHLKSVERLKENANAVCDFYEKRYTGTDDEPLSSQFLEALFQNNGVVGRVPDDSRAGMYYPSGQQQKSVLDYAGPWLMGVTDNYKWCSACCQVRSEYQPGVIGPGGMAADPANPEYRLYRYQRGDVVEPVALAQGCPDEVLGDEMLYCVYNDLAPNDLVYGCRGSASGLGLS